MPCNFLITVIENNNYQSTNYLDSNKGAVETNPNTYPFLKIKNCFEYIYESN